MPRVLLIATTTGYQTRAFGEAAERLGVELVFATDRCHRLDDPWGEGRRELDPRSVHDLPGLLLFPQLRVTHIHHRRDKFVIRPEKVRQDPQAGTQCSERQCDGGNHDRQPKRKGLSLPGSRNGALHKA